MKKQIATVAVLALSSFAFAQDIHFSQLSQMPMLLNPAMTALGHDVMAIVNYRDQWKSVSASPYKTFNVSGDVAFMKKKSGSHGGLGLDFFSDKAGDGNMGTTTGQLHLSGIVALNEHNWISAGAYGGFGQRSLNYDKLYWDNQYINGQLDLTAPSYEPGNAANHSYLDIGAGLGWYYADGNNTISSNDAKEFTAGFSLQHINQPAYSYYGNSAYKLPMKIVGHFGADIGVKNYSLVLEPAIVYMLQGPHQEINAGMLVKYWMQEASVYTGRKKPMAFTLGGYYRVGDAFNIVTAYEMYPFRAGFSYDVNLSDLTAASKARGGFEISLRFIIIETGDNKNKSFFN